MAADWDPATRRRTAPSAGKSWWGANGRDLTALVRWTGCEDRPHLVAHETAGSVTLEIQRHRHAPADAVCDGATAEQLTTTLSTPLGTRHLTNVDGSAGFGLFDAAKLATLTFLPTGYAFSPNVPLGGADPVMQGERFVAPTKPRWERLYTRDVDHASLLITQAIGNNVPSGGTSTSINGHPASLQTQTTNGMAYAETLTWFDGTYTFTLHLQNLVSNATAISGDITRVAQGLRP